MRLDILVHVKIIDKDAESIEEHQRKRYGQYNEGRAHLVAAEICKGHRGNARVYLFSFCGRYLYLVISKGIYGCNFCSLFAGY